MHEKLTLLLSFCSPGSGALPVGLLLAGLAGSTMHCVPMCGPFVLGQVTDRLAAVPVARLCEMSRITNAILLPYHCGRLFTYAALGAAAGLFGHLLGGGVFPAALLLLGAALFLGLAVRRRFPQLRLPGLHLAPPGLVRAIGAAIRGLDRNHWTGGLLLGIALGFLPCGFLYAALAVAAVTGSAGGGALAMLAFGVGTVPSLVVVGLAGHSVGRRWHHAVATAAPVVMLANAVVLATMAWQIMAAARIG